MINVALGAALSVGFYVAAWYLAERVGIVWLPVAVVAGAAIASLVG